MKKIVSLLILVCLILTFAACSNDDADNSTQTTTTTTKAVRPTSPNKDNDVDKDDDDEKKDAVISVGPNYGEWTVEEKNYTCSSRPDPQENFALYVLSESADKEVTLTADITVPITGQAGFMFGITDCNNDGVINENADQYYLVCLRGTRNISVTRCDMRWVNWIQSSDVIAEVGQTLNVSATYTKDADGVKIVVSADGVELFTYTDSNPLTGTAYGLATKDTQPLQNVTAPEPAAEK